jgi:hypothetical protein
LAAFEARLVCELEFDRVVLDPSDRAVRADVKSDRALARVARSDHDQPRTNPNLDETARRAAPVVKLRAP